MGWFYVEIDGIGARAVCVAFLCVRVRARVRVLLLIVCMRGDFTHLGDIIGRWLALLALLLRFDW